MHEVNREIRWGIVGAGGIASRFAEGLAYVRGARLRAVASRSGVSAEKLAQRFDACHAYQSFEELCADTEVDVVYVATPNQFHCEHTLMAISAGKAVLCEKPFALSAREGAEVFEAARRRGVFCMEGMWMRCAPAHERALELCRNGDLGNLQVLSAQLGYLNPFDASSRLFKRDGGGVLFDLGVYPLALAQSFFGSPTNVQASVNVGKSGVDETVSMLLEYPGGRQAVISTSISAELTNTAILVGSHGRLHLAPTYFPTLLRIEPVYSILHRTGRAPGRLSRLRRRPQAQRFLSLARRARDVLQRRETHFYPFGTGLSCEAAEVTRCLRLGLLESPLVPQHDTLEVLKVVDRARRFVSAADGKCSM